MMSAMPPRMLNARLVMMSGGSRIRTAAQSQSSPPVASVMAPCGYMPRLLMMVPVMSRKVAPYFIELSIGLLYYRIWVFPRRNFYQVEI